MSKTHDFTTQRSISDMSPRRVQEFLRFMSAYHIALTGGRYGTERPNAKFHKEDETVGIKLENGDTVFAYAPLVIAAGHASRASRIVKIAEQAKTEFPHLLPESRIYQGEEHVLYFDEDGYDDGIAQTIADHFRGDGISDIAGSEGGARVIVSFVDGRVLNSCFFTLQEISQKNPELQLLQRAVDTAQAIRSGSDAESDQSDVPATAAPML